MEHSNANESAQGQQTQEQMYEEPLDDITGGLPVNLDSLRDGPPGTKPFYPYSTLIRFAIKGSPNQKLLLEDIYYAIESRFPYFRTASSGWKNSVRHNLSLNPCFEKVARPLTDRGKGSYWTVNDSVDPRTGVHRVRAPKQPTNTNVTAAEAAAAVDGMALTGGGENIDGAPPAPAPTGGPKRRGRKAKAKDAPASASRSPSDPDTDAFLADMPFGVGDPPPFSPAAVAAAAAAAGGFPPDPFAVGAPGPGPHEFDPAVGPSGPPPFMIMPPPPSSMADLPIDSAGNVDWRTAWARELAGLQAVTGEAERHGAGDEWYREMLLKVRTGMLMQILPPQLPPPPGPSPPGEQAQ